jgi:hypothetical protein
MYYSLILISYSFHFALDLKINLSFVFSVLLFCFNTHSFFEQGFTLFEESVPDSKQEVRALQSIVATLTNVEHLNKIIEGRWCIKPCHIAQNY